MVYGIHYEGESLHLTLMSYITITLNQFWFVDVSLVKQCIYKYIFYSGDNRSLTHDESLPFTYLKGE